MKILIGEWLVLSAIFSIALGSSSAVSPVDFNLDVASGINWAFHPSDDATIQQLSVTAHAGTAYIIESSADLQAWDTEVVRYGYFAGQVLTHDLFELDQAGAPQGNGQPAVAGTPRESVTVMMRAVGVCRWCDAIVEFTRYRECDSISPPGS